MTKPKNRKIECIAFGAPRDYNKTSTLVNEEYQMAQIDKNMTVGDILDLDRETAVYFLNMGMHCLGCPASRGETVEQACMVHGVDADALVKEINAYLAGKE